MNTLSRRRFAQISSLSLAAAVLAGCSGSSGSSGANTVTWSTWGSPEELKRYDAVQEQFKKDHPEVELVFQPTASYSDYHSKLLTQLSSGTAPDVFYVGDDRIASFIRNGVLLPIEGETSLDLDSFNSSLLDVARFEGALYALPNDCNPDCLWFDKEALKAAGITEDPATLAASDQWTTEAFFAMTAKLKAAGLNGACYWNYWGTHDSIISCGGGKVYDGDTYVANTDPASVKALEEYATRFRSGELIVADLLPEGTGEDSLLVTHQLGFLAAGRYTIGTIEGAGVDKDLYDIVRWPTPDGAAAPTGVAASYLAINAKTKNKAGALAFYDTYLSAAGQELRLSEGGNAVPSITGADEIVLADGYPAHAQTMLDMRDAVFSNYPVEAAVTDLSNEIAVEYMQPLYQGKATTQETLDAIAALVAEKAS